MAYNRTYQYETSPRKLEPEYERIEKRYPKKSSTAKRTTRKEQAKKNKAIKRKIIFTIAICFVRTFYNKL